MYLWWVRGSTGFITLGVHTSPPPAELQAVVEYRELPEGFEDVLDTTEQKLLKYAFELRRRMDDLPWLPFTP